MNRKNKRLAVLQQVSCLNIWVYRTGSLFLGFDGDDGS